MGFERDIDGVKVELGIRNFRKPKEKNNYHWCDCSYRFVAGTVLNYEVNADETLESGEIINLYEQINKLLTGEMREDTEVSFIEPNFVFGLCAEKKLDKHPVQEIKVVWKIYFWNGWLTENYLALTLYRDDIEAFRDYLFSIISGECEW